MTNQNDNPPVGKYEPKYKAVLSNPKGAVVYHKPDTSILHRRRLRDEIEEERRREIARMIDQ